MKFRMLSFRDEGYLSIMCDCSAEFFETSEAIDHVVDEHCTNEERSDQVLRLARVSTLLSPNPIFIEGGGGHATEQKGI